MRKHHPFKSIFYIATGLLICAVYGSCGNNDNEPDPEQVALGQLSATWELGSVINNGTTVNDIFSGFTLTLNSDFTYSTTNGGNPWPAQGTFEFTDNTYKNIRRDDDLAILITEVTETRLVLQFQFLTVRGQANGTEGITGNFTFDLTKSN